MISLKCPYCGANIKINRATNAQKCAACGNEFLLEADEHNNEQTLIDNGNKFLELNEFEKASKSFEQAIELAPDNYAAWLGLAKAESKDFTYFTFQNLPVVEKYISHAVNSATEEEVEIIKQEIIPFVVANENKKQLLKQEKRTKQIHTSINVLFAISFLLTIAIDIYYTLLSPTDIFWRVVGTIILGGIMFFINYVACSAMKLAKPKNWFTITLYYVIAIAIILIILSFSLYLAQTI